MLWYKSWLETRWRFVFVLGSVVLQWLVIMLASTEGSEMIWARLSLTAPLMFCFAAIFLAGSGVNTQSFYGVTSGYHGSMLFTLSLPVSRRQLFLARAALGAVEMSVAIAFVAAITLGAHPDQPPLGAVAALGYFGRAVICSLAVYALSMVLACAVDETWQFNGCCLLLGAALLLQSRSDWLTRISPLRGMSPLSHSVTGPAPWSALLASVLLTVVLLLVALRINERKQY
jgi:hypothetical protein